MKTDIIDSTIYMLLLDLKDPLKVTTRKQLGELKSTSTATPQNITPPNTNIDTDLPMEEVKRKTPRRKSQQPVITYDIVSEVLDQPARISVRDLITTTPKFRRDLASACRIRRKSVEDLPQQTIAQIEDDDINTTAIAEQQKPVCPKP
ncbi:hypothetical protein G6F46_013717 [Rhizopus delemar]|uniref:Uncharacterized protein n=2 Tax=Rhizopus TaxID=4842 RepID=A0A9P7C678_9FUNG|nr:hypothetical protein G6F54_013461 [Rhizopus delemar]KAG1530564.1 hypothetical protein G6F51_013803 [Rhizopus arrhizus]KAG1488915.1 hypothetical protein G6F53_013505 [Rhizopus delemar]KAG1491910.1 hypothetical protein G6F52_013413 [Rhizopus delemar]KAG1537027.1 hypothetical protein G6F50_014940 [Rhizopus delemar]